MSMLGRSEALERRHSDCESRLAAELSRPAPDQATVTSIKREKLRLKETVTQL